jgi:hypothetical protein
MRYEARRACSFPKALITGNTCSWIIFDLAEICISAGPRVLDPDKNVALAIDPAISPECIYPARSITCLLKIVQFWRSTLSCATEGNGTYSAA